MNHRLFFTAVALVSCALLGCGDQTAAKPDASAKASSAPTASAKPAATTTATATSTGSADSGW
jgi:hypothetical protein